MERAHLIAVAGFSTILFFFIFSTNGLAETSLLMVTDKACPYCKAWENDVGKIYPKTELAEQFPLIRMTAGETASEFGTHLEKVRGTPTFIFLKDDLEIGRIEGYSDAEMFWWLVDDIIAQFEKIE